MSHSSSSENGKRSQYRRNYFRFYRLKSILRESRQICSWSELPILATDKNRFLRAISDWNRLLQRIALNIFYLILIYETCNYFQPLGTNQHGRLSISSIDMKCNIYLSDSSIMRTQNSLIQKHSTSIFAFLFLFLVFSHFRKPSKAVIFLNSNHLDSIASERGLSIYQGTFM